MQEFKYRHGLKHQGTRTYRCSNTQSVLTLFVLISTNVITPDNIVSSLTLDTFKARLDKFWENQDVRYNWKADILFTGSRSKVELTVD